MTHKVSSKFGGGRIFPKGNFPPKGGTLRFPWCIRIMYDSPIDIQATQQLCQRYVRGITWPKVGFPGGSVWQSKLEEGFLSAVLANSMFNMCRKIVVWSLQTCWNRLKIYDIYEYKEAVSVESMVMTTDLWSLYVMILMFLWSICVPLAIRDLKIPKGSAPS